MDWDWSWDWDRSEDVADVYVCEDGDEDGDGDGYGYWDGYVTGGNGVHYWWGRRMSSVGHSCFLGMP